MSNLFHCAGLLSMAMKATNSHASSIYKELTVFYWNTRVCVQKFILKEASWSSHFSFYDCLDGIVYVRFTIGVFFLLVCTKHRRRLRISELASKSSRCLHLIIHSMKKTLVDSHGIAAHDST